MTLITCHALNAVTGQHAAGLQATLSFTPDGQTGKQFLLDACTDENGRLHVSVDLQRAIDAKASCELCFEVGSYLDRLASDADPERSGVRAIAIRFTPEPSIPRYHFPISVTPASSSVLMLTLPE